MLPISYKNISEEILRLQRKGEIAQHIGKMQNYVPLRAMYVNFHISKEFF
jgi:hypothetical protein